MATKIFDWENKIVEPIIQEYCEISGTDYGGCIDDWLTEFATEFNSFGEFEVIERVTDVDDLEEYEECWLIFRWDGYTYKFTFHHTSAYGYEFDDAQMFSVKAKRRVHIVYE